MTSEDTAAVLKIVTDASIMISKLAIAAEKLTLALSRATTEAFGLAIDADGASSKKTADALNYLATLLNAGKQNDTPELDDITAGFDQLTFSDRTGAVTRTYAETADEEDGADADSGNDTDV